MSGEQRRQPVCGMFYEPVVAGDGEVVLGLTLGPLPGVEVRDGVLFGDDVGVANRGVSVGRGVDGLRGRPLEPIVVTDGGLCFDPADGGVRTRENRLAGGAHNKVVLEATRFAMVNAFVHTARVARYVNQLLGELGEPALPMLPVVVSAHAGSRLEGFAPGDGDYRSGRMRPLAGGHYRLSQRTTGVPEPVAVCPTGEVHLGPGRLRQRFAGREGYLRAAAHNPATIYHEYGHHLCRHTADFRLNAQRRPSEQRNGKPGVEEGVCDYLAASMLGTGRPYGWYRPARGERRDPAAWSCERDGGGGVDAYTIGARWSSLWWRSRHCLLAGGSLDVEGHDRALVATLVALGESGTADSGSRRRAEAHRCSAGTIVEAYLGAVRDEGGASALDAVAGLVGSGSGSVLGLSGTLSC